MKKCFKCGIEKELSEFYVHRQMSDGHLNKCKVCAKKDVMEHRENNLDKIREYDRCRNKLHHRIKARREYEKTEKGKVAISKGHKKYKESHPEKFYAHNKLSNAIRDGKIIRPSVCSVCGVECIPHGHHWSYLEEHWLDVIWVCVHCHIDIHHPQ